MRKQIGMTGLVLSLLIGGCVNGTRYRNTYERAWPASAIREVKLTDVDGNLHIEASTENQIKLVARVQAVGIEPEKERENDGYFDTDVRDGTLRVGRQRGHGRRRFTFFSMSGIHIDYELRVPASMALDLNMVNGRISVRGVSGQTSIVTVNGPIDIETGGDKGLYAKTVNGHVRAVFLRDFSGARLGTVNGGVEAILPSSASFTCALSQVNGDFEASSSFPLSIHSHPGSRRVSGEVNGGRHELRISTVNGDVEVQQLPKAATAVAR